MQRFLLKSKIHRAKITGANLNYEGSFTIDSDILKSANILPYERISVFNVNNGERFDTYTIPGEPGKREFCLNGAAARKGCIGDEVIIVSYAIISENDVNKHKPIILLLDENNNIIKEYYEIEPYKLVK